MRAAADAVARARTPVLVVSGGWSPFFDWLGPVVARFTGGRFERVLAANHMVQAEAADAFNALLAAFVRRAEALSAADKKVSEKP